MRRGKTIISAELKSPAKPTNFEPRDASIRVVNRDPEGGKK
jgi:hypothetical protein